jgi:hypothetical protein
VQRLSDKKFSEVFSLFPDTGTKLAGHGWSLFQFSVSQVSCWGLPVPEMSHQTEKNVITIKI